MIDFKTIILDILNVINYRGDKEAFITKFTEYINLKSLQHLIQIQSLNKQEEIESQLSTASDNPQKASEILKGYFSEEQIQQSLQNATKDAVFNYITTVNDTISDVQRENLIRTLGKYDPSPSVPSNP